MSAPASLASRIEVSVLPFRHAATVRETLPAKAVALELARIIDVVMTAIGSQGLAPLGPPFVRYHSMGHEMDVEAGIPLAQPIDPCGEVQPSSLPAGPAIHVIHVGDKVARSRTYAALQQYLVRNGLIQAGGPWECFLNDLDRWPDPSDWCTDLYVPLEPGSLPAQYD